MNTLEVKGRTGPSPGVFMGNVEALKECLRSNTLFECIKRWKNLFILRLDKLVWVTAPDREKMLINNGNQMLGTTRLRVWRLARASRRRHGHSEYTAKLGRTHSFSNEGSEVNELMCWML
jgi:hypothetical protein